MQQNVSDLKNKLKTSNQKGLALDIDETICFTLGYWFEKMQAKFGNPENLSTHQLIKKYRYAKFVPYWQTEECFTWMRNAIDDNRLQEKLTPIPGAAEALNKLVKNIPIVAYISTRPETVLEGTRNWLRKYNFPEAELIFRPMEVEHMNGSIWKAKILEYLYPEILGIIDDQPELVTALSTTYKGTVYHYDYSKKLRNDIKVIPCQDWQEVKENIIKAA